MSELSLAERLLVKNNILPSWYELLKPIVTEDDFYQILSGISNDMPNVTPATEDIFAVFRYIAVQDIRVIILGQGPYPQPNVATGIAYGNVITSPELSPSLSIIMDELIETELITNEFNFFQNIDLLHWCEQGVLLLNTSLTTRLNQPGAHKKLWKPFMEKLLVQLDKENLIVVMTGNQAQAHSHCFTKAKHKIKVAHPAADTFNNNRKFRGSKVFLKINNALQEMKMSVINWQGKI